MQKLGFRIAPMRPAIEEVLGEKAYASLSEIPFPIDLVDVFRAPDQIAPIIDEAMPSEHRACGCRKVWSMWPKPGVHNLQDYKL